MVVEYGCTLTYPAVYGIVPMPLSMYIEDASWTFHFRLELLPALMLVGSAAKARITGKDVGVGEGVGASVTATVTDWVTLPAALAAVRV